MGAVPWRAATRAPGRPPRRPKGRLPHHAAYLPGPCTVAEPKSCTAFPNVLETPNRPPRTSALHFIFDTHHPMDGYPPTPAFSFATHFSVPIFATPLPLYLQPPRYPMFPNDDSRLFKGSRLAPYAANMALVLYRRREGRAAGAAARWACRGRAGRAGGQGGRRMGGDVREVGETGQGAFIWAAGSLVKLLRPCHAVDRIPYTSLLHSLPAFSPPLPLSPPTAARRSTWCGCCTTSRSCPCPAAARRDLDPTATWTSSWSSWRWGWGFVDISPN